MDKIKIEDIEPNKPISRKGDPKLKLMKIIKDTYNNLSVYSPQSKRVIIIKDHNNDQMYKLPMNDEIKGLLIKNEDNSLSFNSSKFNEIMDSYTYKIKDETDPFFESSSSEKEEIDEDYDISDTKGSELSPQLTNYLNNTLGNSLIIPISDKIVGKLTSLEDSLETARKNNINLYDSKIKIDNNNDILQLILKKRQLDEHNDLKYSNDPEINLDISLQKIKDIYNENIPYEEKDLKIKEFVKDKITKMEKLMKKSKDVKKLKVQSKKQQIDELKKYLKKH